MSFKSDLLSLIFQTSTITSKIYLRFCSAADEFSAPPTLESAGTETDYDGYPSGGIGVDTGTANWDNVIDFVIENKNIIQFPVSEDSGQHLITHVEAWVDNVSSDVFNRISYCELPNPLLISLGSQPQILAGKLAFLLREISREGGMT